MMMKHKLVTTPDTAHEISHQRQNKRRLHNLPPPRPPPPTPITLSPSVNRNVKHVQHLLRHTTDDLKSELWYPTYHLCNGATEDAGDMLKRTCSLTHPLSPFHVGRLPSWCQCAPIMLLGLATFGGITGTIRLTSATLTITNKVMIILPIKNDNN